MVCLKAFRCHNCSLICERSDAFPVVICVNCGKWTCGPCITLFEQEGKKATKCTVTQKKCVYRYPYTGYLEYLHKFAPDDELKLLNYGKWCPIRCSKRSCASSFAMQRIGYVGIGMLCTKCLRAGRTVKEPPINTCMRITNELRGYFSDQECIVTTRKEMQLERFKCQLCKARMDCYNCNVYFTKTGDLMCNSCKEKSSAYHTRRRISCIYWLAVLLRYVPDMDDLKLLTYSKWTPLRCELCSSPFSTIFLQLPMFHPGCSKIMCNQCLSKHTCSEANATSIRLRWILDLDKELRSFFKNGGDDTPATPFKKTASEGAQYNSLRLPSTYDLDKTTSSAVSGIPNKIPPATPFKKTASEGAQYNSLRLPSTYDLDKTTSSAVSGIPNKIPPATPFKKTASEGAQYNSLRLPSTYDLDKPTSSAVSEIPNKIPPATPFKKTASEGAQYNSLRLPSTYDLEKPTSSAVAAIPDKIKCESCTQLNTPSNLRMCSDCKKSCLCFTCLTKEHWGHHIDELETALHTTVIRKESEKTLEKLANWTDSVSEGYRQIHVGCGKVVDNYNWLYTKAIRETDLALLHTIRERSNIGQLKTSIDRLIGAQIMVRSSVEELEKSLSDIVTEEKAVCAENDVASNAAGASTSK